MKNIYILIFTTLFSSQFLFNDNDNLEKTIVPDSTATLTLSIVGDLMCHTPQMEYARIGKDSFDFKPAFREVKKFLTDSDLTLGNLETTIAGKVNGYTGYPLFNSPDEYLDALKDAGFDILFTSNNHSVDRGRKGIIRTIEKIHSAGMSSIGTFQSQHDRDSVRIFEINGIKIAILAYTYGLNGNYLLRNEKFLVNVIDTNLIKLDIKNARNKEADVVLLYFHFGEEYKRKPSVYQKEIVKSAINSGADLIIGSHPHVLQPIEYFVSDKNSIGKGITAFSLGNFFSNQRWRYSDSGVMLNIILSKNIFTGKVLLTNLSAIPTWVYKGKINNMDGFLILPSDTIMGNFSNRLSKTDRLRFLQANDDTRKMYYSIINQTKLPLSQITH